MKISGKIPVDEKWRLSIPFPSSLDGSIEKDPNISDTRPNVASDMDLFRDYEEEKYVIKESSK